MIVTLNGMNKFAKILILIGISTGISIAIFSRTMTGGYYEIITFKQWFEHVPFEPVVFDPLPDDTILLLGPYHNQSVPNYAELSYATHWGTETPPEHHLYQSTIPFYGRNGNKKSYSVDREDVTASHQVIEIDNQTIEIELRRNEGLPNEGMIHFQLGDTWVFYLWRSTTEDEAARFLQQHATLVKSDNKALIERLDNQLEERSEWVRAMREEESGG